MGNAPAKKKYLTDVIDYERDIVEVNKNRSLLLSL